MEKNDKKFWMGEAENEEQFLEELLKKFEAAKEAHRNRKPVFRSRKKELIYERARNSVSIDDKMWENLHKRCPDLTREEAEEMAKDFGF